MSTFVLIHGSMHGRFCWRDLIPELEARGHRVIAPDLPCEDARAGLADYADTVEEALEIADVGMDVDAAQGGAANASARHPSDPDDGHDVVLVGHSLGGRTLPVIAARRPVSRMVFLCCVPTTLGPIDVEAFSEMVTDAYASAEIEERPDGTKRMTVESATRVFFHDCSPQTARWAAQSLRWQGPKPLSEPAPIDVWPAAVPIEIVLARDDAAVRFDWAEREARRWLDGGEPIVIAGSHSPFFSRPAELAAILEDSR